MRINVTLTIGAAPINITTGMTAAQMAAAGMTSQLAPAGATFFVQPMRLRSISFQMIHGGSGLGYVLTGSVGRAPAAVFAASDLVAELDFASAQSPGGSWSDSDDFGRIQGENYWVHGANPGDKVQVSYDTY
ncbi:MAG TPA: hypothetical protein VKX49_12680 [Bryobacteraceae bacterium]|nr:hypothetical protein [Bryobacteraceae bacterium]